MLLFTINYNTETKQLDYEENEKFIQENKISEEKYNALLLNALAVAIGVKCRTDSKQEKQKDLLKTLYQISSDVIKKGV